MIFERSLVLKEKIKLLKSKRASRADFGPLRQASLLGRLDCGLVFLKSEGFFVKFSLSGRRTAG
jgi:hypothetical protein